MEIKPDMRFNDGNVSFKVLSKIPDSPKKYKPGTEMWLVQYGVSGLRSFGSQKSMVMTREKILEMAGIAHADRTISDMNTVGSLPARSKLKPMYQQRVESVQRQHLGH